MIYLIYVKLYTHRGKCKMLKKTGRENKEKKRNCYLKNWNKPKNCLFGGKYKPLANLIKKGLGVLCFLWGGGG